MVFRYGSLGRLIHLFFLFPFQSIAGAYCNLFIYSPVHGHLGYFQLGAITGQAAMNNLVLFDRGSGPTVYMFKAH